MLVALALTLAAVQVGAQGFSFSQPDTSAQREQQAREQRVAELLSTPCRAGLKDKKIMVVIGEMQSNGFVTAEQQNYGPHFQAINQRLRALGLKTWTPEEIRKQVAQAEINAYFRNDPDAALAASKRLGANFVLRGLIASQAAPNPMMAVNQVTVTMGFTLSEASGKVISNAEARGASYAGTDVPGHGADARERRGRRDRRPPVRRPLPERGIRPAPEVAPGTQVIRGTARPTRRASR